MYHLGNWNRRHRTERLAPEPSHTTWNASTAESGLSSLVATRSCRPIPKYPQAIETALWTSDRQIAPCGREPSRRPSQYDFVVRGPKSHEYAMNSRPIPMYRRLRTARLGFESNRKPERVRHDRRAQAVAKHPSKGETEPMHQLTSGRQRAIRLKRRPGPSELPSAGQPKHRVMRPGQNEVRTKCNGNRRFDQSFSAARRKSPASSR